MNGSRRKKGGGAALNARPFAEDDVNKTRYWLAADRARAAPAGRKMRGEARTQGKRES